MTGGSKKGEVIQAFLKNNHPSQIVFIDDRKDLIANVQEACHQNSIPFIGILFKGAELIEGEADPRVAEFQKQQLFQQVQWLEDEEARHQLFGDEEYSIPLKTSI